MKHIVAFVGFGVSAALVALLVGGITGKVRSERLPVRGSTVLATQGFRSLR